MNDTSNSTLYQLQDRWEKFVGLFDDAIEWMIERLCGGFEGCQEYLENRRSRRRRRAR